MTPHRKAVAGERLLWTWNPVTLAATGAGYGPVARSACWPHDTRGDPTGGLGSRTRFLEPGTETLSGAEPVPCSLALDRTDAWTRVIRKEFLGKDAYGRNSRWLVHAMLFPPGTLTPVDVLWADASGLFNVDVDAADLSLRTDLPPVLVPGQPPQPVRPELLARWGDHARLLIAVLLTAERKVLPTSVIARATDSAQVASLLATMFGLLPQALSVRRTFSTFEARSGAPRLDVVGHVTPFSQAEPDAGRPWLDLVTGESQLPEPAPCDLETAEALIAVAADGAVPPEHLSTGEELRRWAQGRTLRRRPPASLTDEELLELLATATAADPAIVEAWWQVCLVRLPTAGTVIAEALLHECARIVGQQAPESRGRLAAELVDPLVSLALGPRADDASAARLRERLADTVATLLPCEAHEVSRLVVARATERLRGTTAGPAGSADRTGSAARTESAGPVPADLAERVIAVSGKLCQEDRRLWLSQPGFTAYAVGVWSGLAVGIADAALSGAQWALPAFELLVQHHPERVAELIGDRLAQRGVGEEQLLTVIRTISVNVLPALFDGFIRLRQLDPGFLLFDLLDDPRLEDEAVRRQVLVPLLRRHWSELGVGARLPKAVVISLGAQGESQPAVKQARPDARNGPTARRPKPEPEQAPPSAAWRWWRSRGDHR